MEHTTNHEAHTHQCGTGCGCDHEHKICLSEQELQLLREIAQNSCVPVAQFALCSTKSDHLHGIALSPVYLLDAANALEEVRERGTALRDMEDAGLISLDFGGKHPDLDYAVYDASAVYQQFMQTVQQAGEHPEFLYNAGRMEYGVMAATCLGREFASNAEDQA